MARCTSAAVRPAARSLTGSSHTLIWRLRPPSELHLADAGDVLDAAGGRCLSATSVTSRIGLVGVERDVEDRRGVGVDLGDDRRVDVLGKMRKHAVHVVAHLLRGDVDVLVEDEGDEHLRHALAGDRAELVDAADGVDRLFDLVGDLGLDFFGRGAGEAGDDGDHGEVDLGEAVDAELEVAGRADDADEEDEHGGEDRALDADLGEPLHDEFSPENAAICELRSRSYSTELPSFSSLPLRATITSPRCDTLGDRDDVAHLFAGLDHALFELFLADHEDVLGRAFIAKRGGWDHRAVVGAEPDLGGGEHPGLELAGGVVEACFDDQIAARTAKSGADVLDGRAEVFVEARDVKARRAVLRARWRSPIRKR